MTRKIRYFFSTGRIPCFKEQNSESCKNSVRQRLVQDSSHQRLEALFLTGLPTKWVWKKGKGIHKAFKRTWLCLYSYNTEEAIFQDFLYILTLGMAEIPYLLFVSVPSKSYSEIKDNSKTYFSPYAYPVCHSSLGLYSLKISGRLFLGPVIK